MAKAAAASLGELLALSPTPSETWPEGTEVMLQGMHGALVALTRTQTSPLYAGGSVLGGVSRHGFFSTSLSPTNRSRGSPSSSP